MNCTSHFHPNLWRMTSMAGKKALCVTPHIRKEPQGHKDHAVKEAGALSGAESAPIRVRHEHAREPFRAAPPRGHRRCRP